MSVHATPTQEEVFQDVSKCRRPLLISWLEPDRGFHRQSLLVGGAWLPWKPSHRAQPPPAAASWGSRHCSREAAAGLSTPPVRDKWTISSKTGQILVGAKFYLQPSWGLVEAAVPVREEPMGGDKLGEDEPRLPSPRAGNVCHWEEEASAPQAGRHGGLGSVVSSAHEHSLVLCSGAGKPAVTLSGVQNI